MKHVIIGTAGHVDHGKTTLIQALTGTNTDRLKEEQERGMSIDIGFASIKLPDGSTAGIVDVPGHERFLKNMLAGATGVDVALLVVAADEGIMPQTIEHMEILRLLDVRNGVVAITKCDITDREWIDVVEEDIRRRLESSPLAGSPVIRVSTVTNKGIDQLKKALLSASSRALGRNSALPARLPVDRVFTMVGFGTVVTGTLTAGALQIGDSVEVMPQRLLSRIRGLQVHGAKVSHAEAGCRVAVNLSGIETDALERGAQLCSPRSLAAVKQFDAHLTMVADTSAELKHRSRVRIHIGTAEIIGRMLILDERSAICSGDQGFVQFIAESEIAAARGDRFVVRTYSPMHTIAGGQIVSLAATVRKKGNKEVLTSLEALLVGSSEDQLREAILPAVFGLTLADAAAALTLTAEEALFAATALQKAGDVIQIGKDRYISTARCWTLLDRAVSAVEAYHSRFPLRPGMPREELRSLIMKSADSRLFGALLGLWEGESRFVCEQPTVRLPSFTVQMNERQLNLLERIEARYVECGIATPTLKEVSTFVRAPIDAVAALLKLGVDRGRFYYIADGAYYASKTVEHFKAVLGQFMQNHPAITVGEFRDLTGSNRKLAVQALEFLDSIRFTVRHGDDRSIADG